MREVVARLGAQGIRADVDDSPDRMQKKIRTAQQQKVPFMLIAGGSDAESNAVSFRYRDATQRNGVLIEAAIAEVVDFVGRRVNTSPTADDFSAS